MILELLRIPGLAVWGPRRHFAPHWPKSAFLEPFHHDPLRLSPMGHRHGYRPGTLPNTEELSERVVRLPCFFEVSEEGQQQERIVAAIYDFFNVAAPS